MATFDDTAPGAISPYPAGEFRPVQTAATVNTSLSVVPATIGGLTLGPFDTRILLTGQSSPVANGIFQLTNNGSEIESVLAASASSTVTGLTAGRLYPVRCTGTATCTGSNGVITSAASGFLTSAGTTFTINGGADGGSVFVSFNEPNNTTLTRADDANADAEFVSYKVIQVSGGTNAGKWQIGAIGGTVISVPASIPITLLAAGVITPPGVTFSNTAPGTITV